MAQINIGRVLPIFMGEYDAETSYNKLDIVSYQGSSYVSRTNNIGRTPTNTTYWRLVAQGGTWSDMSETEKEEVIERLADDLVDLSYEEGEVVYSTGKEILLKDRAQTQYLWPTTQAKSVWDGSTNVHDKLATLNDESSSQATAIHDLNQTVTQHTSRLSQLLSTVTNIRNAVETLYISFNLQVLEGYVTHSRLSVEGATIIFEDDEGTTYSKILDSTGYFSFALKGYTTYTVYLNIDGETHEEVEETEMGVRRVNYDYN